ncbi:hypothetical protein BGX27_008833 [Mortierella sp. AM989]|nr:hypothetical protein BGX27_008833 [Mortierella sp. AM989]
MVATPVANTMAENTTNNPIHNNTETLNTTSHPASSTSAHESHKTSPANFKTLRHQPSPNPVASNATTIWTIGQQKNTNNSRSRPSDATLSSASTANTNTNTLAAASSATSKTSKTSGAEEKPLDGVDAHSSRSKFLRAFGKFKNKHLSQKKANAATTGAISVTSNNSSDSNDASSKRSSFVLPPMQFDREDSLISAEQGSEVNPAGHSDSASISMRSYIEPITPKENIEQLHDIDMEDSEARCSSPQDRSASSSLRNKFKNRVNTTLASIKSSSNLREKAKSQSATASTSLSSPNSSDQPPVQQSQPSPTSTAADSQQDPNMIRLAKPFWTFPRVRPEPIISSKVLPWESNGRPNCTSPKTKTMQNADLDTVMISPELGPSIQASAENEDSDDSIDIILPSDYDDYTQFAELPLKKRKKLLAAAAAAAAQDTSSKRSQTMKRFLLPQKTAADKDKAKTPENSHSAMEASHAIPQKSNSKKRPKDQDSIEQRRGQEPNKMAKSNSEEPSEWRKAIMKSLHIGKGNQVVRKTKGPTASDRSSLESSLNDTLPQTDLTVPPGLFYSPQRDSGVYPSDQGTRLKRSDSINSTRSRSMATSSHPGLLATTLPKPVNPSSRRETLEMAMRRRRRSSAARSNIFDPEVHLTVPRSSNYYEDDTASAHVTHTFTSFTLELADVHHANAVVNNSVTPGLFNFKRQPRLTMSSMNQIDTENEFKGFDSDGDAMSGYTGDADVSMEEIFVRPKTPTASRSPEARDKGKSRESSSLDHSGRRKMSIGDADSDTLPELPVLSNRARDLNRSSNGSRANNSANKPQENVGRESPRSPRRTGSSGSPILNRKTSRNFLNGSLSVDTSPTAPTRDPATQLSMDEVASWKPRNILQQSRTTMPALNTKPMLAIRGTNNGHEVFHHPQRQPSSADTLLPNHLKNFSTASTLSASSGYSAQTLNGNAPLTFQPKEFDPNQELDLTTPVDLKTMDFDTLLKTAEREQHKGQEERTLKKKKSFQFQNSRPLKINHHGTPGDRSNVENYSNGFYKGSTTSNNKSALSALVASAPNLDEMRTRGPDANHHGYGNHQHSPPNSTNHGRSHSSNGGKFSGLQMQTNRVEQRPLGQSHPRVPISKSVISFDLAESETMSNSGGRSNPRSKRVMKKKTSVIKLSGNVQGRREDDGMIRVSVAPNVDHRQWRS